MMVDWRPCFTFKMHWTPAPGSITLMGHMLRILLHRVRILLDRSHVVIVRLTLLVILHLEGLILLTLLSKMSEIFLSHARFKLPNTSFVLPIDHLLMHF